jgi:hypothetical protein
MLMKIGGLARAIAIVLAIVAGFMALNVMNVPLVFLVLGLVAGLALTDDRLVLNVALVIALPIVGAALTHMPTIGAQLNAIALNLQIAMAGGIASAVAIRMYHLVMGGVMGLAGGAASGMPAPVTR